MISILVKMLGGGRNVDDQNVEMVFLVDQNVEIRTSKMSFELITTTTIRTSKIDFRRSDLSQRHR